MLNNSLLRISALVVGVLRESPFERIYCLNAFDAPMVIRLFPDGNFYKNILKY